MSIKASLGKLRLTIPVREFVVTHLAANGFKQLDLTLNHVARVESLAWHHRDPFDRLLLAQAMEENLSIISADQSMTLYDIDCVW
jgi:PIN domain nuclease of toxin-antitoxin system